MSLHFSFAWKWINWTNHGLDSNPNLREEHTEHFQQLHLKEQEEKHRYCFQSLKQISPSYPRCKANFWTSFKNGPTKAKCPYFHILLLYFSRKEFSLLTDSPLNLLDKAVFLEIYQHSQTTIALHQDFLIWLIRMHYQSRGTDPYLTHKNYTLAYVLSSMQAINYPVARSFRRSLIP